MVAAHALNDHIKELFPGATEAVEEAIINTLLDADTTQGNGHVIPRLDAASQLFTLATPGERAYGNGSHLMFERNKLVPEIMITDLDSSLAFWVS